jgi:hypothetical protein
MSDKIATKETVLEFIKEMNALCEKYGFFITSGQTKGVEVSQMNGNKVVGLVEVYEFPADLEGICF